MSLDSERVVGLAVVIVRNKTVDWLPSSSTLLENASVCSFYLSTRKMSEEV